MINAKGNDTLLWISCRWRYWSHMLAWCIFHHRKWSVFWCITTFIWYKCCHLILCLRLIEPFKQNSLVQILDQTFPFSIRTSKKVYNEVDEKAKMSHLKLQLNVRWTISSKTTFYKYGCGWGRGQDEIWTRANYNWSKKQSQILISICKASFV